MDIGVPVGANKMTPIVPKALEDYCAAHTTSPDPLLDELAAYTRTHCKDPQMLTGPVKGTLLRMLVQLSGARRVLEIGTYTGYSALSMAAGLPDDGELITCDIDPETTRIAHSFWARSPHGGKIRQKPGAALDTLRALPSDLAFDFVFLVPTMCMDAQVPRSAGMRESGQGELRKLLRSRMVTSAARWPARRR
jgi:caffeoyl-CoA O-methyltransferase